MRYVPRPMLYAAAQEFERKAAEIYFELHLRFVDDGELAKLWLDMAIDELEHAALVEYCARFPDRTVLPVSRRQLTRLRRQLERSMLLARSPGLTARRALKIAWVLEHSEINTIFASLTCHITEPYFLIQRKMSEVPHSHIRRLRDVGTTFDLLESIYDEFA